MTAVKVTRDISVLEWPTVLAWRYLKQQNKTEHLVRGPVWGAGVDWGTARGAPPGRCRGTVEGSRPEEDSRFTQLQPHPAGQLLGRLLHRHHVTVHTRAGVAQRATPRWPGSSARGAGTVVPVGPTRVGSEAAEGPVSPRQRSPPRSFPPASPRPRRPAPPTARGAQGGRAPRASTRPKQGPGGHAHLRHPAPRPAAGDSDPGAPRPAARPCGDLAGQPSSAGAVSPEGRPLLSGRGAAAGGRASSAAVRPRPLRGHASTTPPRCPDSAHQPPPRGCRSLPASQPAGCNRPSSGDEREATWKAFHQNELWYPFDGYNLFQIVPGLKRSISSPKRTVK